MLLAAGNLRLLPQILDSLLVQKKNKNKKKEMFVFTFFCISLSSFFIDCVTLTWHILTQSYQVLVFTGNDVAIIISTSKARYTPKGRLHGNDKVSLSKGFVKCDIIQRGKEYFVKELLCAVLRCISFPLQINFALQGVFIYFEFLFFVMNFLAQIL